MIIDLRDYTLRPGTRDQLIERFEQLFMDEQERLGARMLGVFRDLDRPERWVWLRACPDFAERKRVLTAFYEQGEMWQTHKAEVNSWLVDSDDVLFLRSTAELGAPATGPSTVGMYTHVERQPLTADRAAALDREVTAAVAEAGGRLLARFATDPSENNYPRHPIRSGEHGLVWFATFAVFRPLAITSVEQRRLAPTTRSRMR